jgi:hypothetical protein
LYIYKLVSINKPSGQIESVEKLASVHNSCSIVEITNPMEKTYETEAQNIRVYGANGPFLIRLGRQKDAAG